MISLEQFITNIQSSIQSANDVLRQDNLNLLETYFEDSEEAQEIKTSLDRALEAMQEVVEDTTQSRQAIEKAMRAFSDAKEAFQSENQQKGSGNQVSSLKPKTVAMQFPEQTTDGTVMRNVHVPLISLVPISMTQVSEVKFRANLELQVKDDVLQVGFLPSGATVSADDSNANGTTTGAYIEITISPQESSEGLKKLIMGYDSMLRGQMPN